ncbi:hypothetical protein DEU56DRAFT_744063, partial [Suillus clintonianus]|uniref:uncharacterized protein n=1 Tax=Suillus clintonianus TaxID=1904413 RepID=UPI001B885C46
SIILQSSNERCNYLQGLLGVFFHSTSVPQKVIDVLAHAGLSISVTSIHNAIHSIPRLTAFAWHVRNILVQHGRYFGTFADKLGEPESVLRIPVTKTEQIPFRSMRIKQSTADGNMEVMENLLRQGGIGDPTDKDFESAGDVDMSEHVLLIHGDLLTKERLDTVSDTRRIESTPKNRFQYIIFLPGLFHYKMACADAIWRTYLQPKEGRDDSNSMFQHVGILRPQETGRISTKPGFRRMHDVIHHDLHASILECWRLEAQSRQPVEWQTLEKFGKSEPGWDLLVEMSEAIVNKYVATSDKLGELRARPVSERDEEFENQCLRNRDQLLYVDLCQAMNAGDIGRVEASFLPWIYIFCATGKHKYAAQINKFSTNLRYVYPQDLCHIIRLNLLCNPTGKSNAFRAVDWLVERNNLYTKVVIFAGTGPNRTIDHIIKQSPLIEVFRNCHVIMENAFYLKNRTIQHTHPNMAATIEKLRSYIQSTLAYIPQNRSSKRVIEDQIAVGMKLIQQKKVSQTTTGEERYEAEPEDFVNN